MPCIDLRDIFGNVVVLDVPRSEFPVWRTTVEIVPEAPSSPQEPRTTIDAMLDSHRPAIADCAEFGE